MKIALAIALVPVYFVILAIGPVDDPSVETAVIFSLIVTVLFALAFLRLTGGPWWFPPLIVGLVYFVGHYPLVHFTTYLQIGKNLDEAQAFQGSTVIVVGPITTVVAACIASWVYKKKAPPVDL